MVIVSIPKAGLELQVQQAEHRHCAHEEWPWALSRQTRQKLSPKAAEQLGFLTRHNESVGI